VRSIYATGSAVVVFVLVVGTLVGFTADDWRISANMSLLYIAVLATLWSVLYAVRSDWQTNAVGRTLLVQSVLMSAVMWQATVSIWWNPDYPGRDHVRFVVYTMGALSYLVMLRTLSRAQRTPPGPDVPESGL